jgi:copper chaperone CopZ
MTEQRVRVGDMMCDGCADSLRRAVEQVAGVEQLAIDVPRKTVSWQGGATREQVVAAIEGAGYTAE